MVWMSVGRGRKHDDCCFSLGGEGWRGAIFLPFVLGSTEDSVWGQRLCLNLRSFSWLRLGTRGRTCDSGVNLSPCPQIYSVNTDLRTFGLPVDMTGSCPGYYQLRSSESFPKTWQETCLGHVSNVMKTQLRYIYISIYLYIYIYIYISIYLYIYISIYIYIYILVLINPTYLPRLFPTKDIVTQQF